MRVEILQRNSPCRECRERSSENGHKMNVKRVRYDCSSLTAHRSGRTVHMFVETSLKLGRTDMLEFSIDTGGYPPIKQRPYRVSKAEGDVMEAEIQQYLESNFIRPFNSPWASPVLMIRKPAGGIRSASTTDG
ncbi:hypothetical protein PI124_g785 [Phytophthora idaei]|nr:hypothetical protein PI125_g24250 [Phytophthora idaei]KAG3165847.1 hypothetical protein PI126_g4451 [Phytophthora idaei]KAG3254673.1 hypothetical protein PI124_g785 [Phytophthora idaei]